MNLNLDTFIRTCCKLLKCTVSVYLTSFYSEVPYKNSPKQWIRGIVVNFICKTKSQSNQDASFWWHAQVRLENQPKPCFPSWLLFPIFIESIFCGICYIVVRSLDICLNYVYFFQRAGHHAVYQQFSENKEESKT